MVDWRNASTPRLNGRPLTRWSLTKYPWAVAVQDKRALLGTDWYLRLFNDQGLELWETVVPAAALAVNVSRDTRLAVAALGDGTIRWYGMGSGQELLALFPQVESGRWVAWTPGDYYDANAGGDNLIGLQVNHGADHAADFFPIGRFGELFNRPDIVTLVLDTLATDEAKRRADAGIASRQASEITILSPPDHSSVTTPTLELTYLMRSPAPIAAVTVSVDGLPMRTAPPILLTTGADGSVFTVAVPMPEHDTTISLMVANGQSQTSQATVQVGWHRVGNRQ